MDKDRFYGMLESISDSFYKSPLQIFFFVAVFVLFIVLIILVWNWRVKKDREESGERVRNAWKKYLDEYKLSQAEINFINRLARFLTDPSKRYILLVNQHTFMECFNALKEKESPDMDLAVPLAMKLGYRITDPREMPRSSRDLAEGTPVAIVDREKNASTGLVSRQLPNSLVLALPSSKSLFDEGEDLVLLFHNFAGLFEIRTKIQKTADQELWLAHSGNLIKIQRRSFYRKKINIPIQIRREGLKEPDETTFVIDMSLGGLSIRNPELKYKKGDDLSLYFYKASKEVFHLYGEVVRVTRGGSVLHLKFGHLSSKEQDRIAAVINAGHF
jgi:hypothetical protein